MKTVVVGMSGGVDSSVCAYLLKEQGYNVIGVTMQIWQDEDACSLEQNGGCCGTSAVSDARRVATELKIPYYVMNFRDVFREKVIDYFIREYRSGRTPNPCIACNRYVKWESLLEKSMAIGADYIATGHYATVVRLENGRFALRTAKSEAGRSKDQTYALYNLTQNQLSRTIMPCGQYTKDEIREIADRAGLPVAHKPDSEEICFVPDKDYAGFIERDTGIRDEPGSYVDEAGNILGKHKGITHYTIGQRKRLGIALGRPVFVKEIRPASNEVVLSDNAALFSRELYAEDLNFMSVPDITGRESVTAKIRYNHGGAPAVVEKVAPDRVRIEFEEPQRAITPGQSVVLYRDGVVLGGGTII
ncbi:MAG TPA: tRNA 2-thiouridine(34) synthase MnmA [Lachnospiraceae bacterium]|nr:tRNA 2-thiouridine(34) synthase MnmA [Lachnospiraceae bacterium]